MTYMWDYLRVYLLGPSEFSTCRIQVFFLFSFEKLTCLPKTYGTHHSPQGSKTPVN